MRGFLRPGFIVRFVVAGAVIGVVALIGILAVLWAGGVNLAASVPHSRLEYGVLHWTFKRWTRSEAAAVAVPDNIDDPARVALGARHYEQVCSTCHGAPGIGQNPLSLAMKPAPQYLPAVVDQFSDAQLFVILEKGVMMSAMPPWIAENRPDEIWSVVAFLRAMKDMSAEDYIAMTSLPPRTGPTIPFEAPDRLSEAALDVPYPPEEHLAAAPSLGFTDHARAGVPVAACDTCHGTDGTGAPTMGKAPNLTLLSTDYISRSLEAYATGERRSGFMQQMAAELSTNQIDRLARYFGETLEDTAIETAAVGEPEAIARGAGIVRGGVHSAGVPACVQCHGTGRPEDIEGAGVLVPEIAGQNAVYIEDQLHAFARPGGRGGASLWSPMAGIAARMSDEDMAAAAAFLGSLEPGADLGAPEVDVTETQLAAAREIVTGVCKECHTEAMTGQTSGEFPNLTLQTGPYVMNQLWNFRSGHRTSSRMEQTAIRLSEREIASLAALVDGLDPVATPGPGTPDPADVAAGGEIAENGIPDRGVPACLSCHGADVAGRLPLVARLHGQYPGYIESRLRGYSADEIDDRGISPMPEIATKLTGEEIAALGAWFSTREPLAKD